jgi:hypothetical protein
MMDQILNKKKVKKKKKDKRGKKRKIKEAKKEKDERQKKIIFFSHVKISFFILSVFLCILSDNIIIFRPIFLK